MKKCPRCGTKMKRTDDKRVKISIEIVELFPQPGHQPSPKRDPNKEDKFIKIRVWVCPHCGFVEEEDISRVVGP